MKLSQVAQLPSVVVLGPGFTGGGWLVLEDPRAVGPGERGHVAFVGYGPVGSAPTVWTGRPRHVETLELDVAPEPLQPRVTSTKDEHHQAVEAIRALIAQGDVYQVNHTVRAALQARGGAQVFAALCARGVPRFAAWVKVPGTVEFVSASPEMFFEVRGNTVRVEPMKGTAPPAEEETLRRSEKDVAELAMITDLMRNDVTPLCEPHSVRVVNARRLVRLPYAVQAVADVEGTLLPGRGALEVLDALSPCGSVTGAPKRAAMEVIARLEPTPRGPYCGALGWLGEDEARFCVLIRTAWREPDGWKYGTGGGIVWDSQPEKEYEEIHVKLGALWARTPL